MLPACDTALKEWQLQCDVLARGWRSLLARKGGLIEGPGGFRVEYPEFWLLPTGFHQSATDLEPSLAASFQGALPALPPAGRLHLQHYAEVVDQFRIEAASDLPLLAGLQPLSQTVLRQRFEYRRPGLTLLLLRIFRRPTPWDLPDRPEYAGCRSWVTLDAPLSTGDLTPVLSDAEFAAQAQAVLTALERHACRASPAARSGP